MQGEIAVCNQPVLSLGNEIPDPAVDSGWLLDWALCSSGVSQSAGSEAAFGEEGDASRGSTEAKPSGVSQSAGNTVRHPFFWSQAMASRAMLICSLHRRLLLLIDGTAKKEIRV